jgi:heptosyltransferase-2
MSEFRDILIVQTAFLGDVVLTLPLLQIAKERFPSANIDMIVTPQAAGLLANHPSLRDAIVFDKRGRDTGIAGFLRLAASLRARNYQLALVPHRSVRSAALVRVARASRRIGFTTSAGGFMFTDRVRYDSTLHEVRRNLSLLTPLGIDVREQVYPDLYPSDADNRCVENLLARAGIDKNKRMIGIAPGTVWNTKRWPKEHFIGLAVKLQQSGCVVVLIGGPEDRQLCEEIYGSSMDGNIVSTAGELTLLQSASLIKRCRAVVSNDSAPMHLALASRTPVVVIYGATAPEFGFAPYGEQDVIVQTEGLDCRPCSIHGGDRCPVTTFDCMKRISAEDVFRKVLAIVEMKKT